MHDDDLPLMDHFLSFQHHSRDATITIPQEIGSHHIAVSTNDLFDQFDACWHHFLALS